MITPKVLDKIVNLITHIDIDIKKNKIIDELSSIGYQFKYQGTHYLVDTILYVGKNKNNLVENLQTKVYPVIAEKYHKSPWNIKSSINKATECMYYECDSTKLENYFKFHDDTKPTVKEVIFTVINRIKEQK